jgi:hypothetical protein
MCDTSYAFGLVGVFGSHFWDPFSGLQFEREWTASFRSSMQACGSDDNVVHGTTRTLLDLDVSALLDVLDRAENCYRPAWTSALLVRRGHWRSTSATCASPHSRREGPARPPDS